MTPEDLMIQISDENNIPLNHAILIVLYLAYETKR